MIPYEGIPGCVMNCKWGVFMGLLSGTFLAAGPWAWVLGAEDPQEVR